MLLLESIIPVLFIILAVWYAGRLVSDTSDFKSVLVKFGIILLAVMVALWIGDLFFVMNKRLLSDKARDEILAMIRYLFFGMVALFFYKNKSNTK